MIITIIQIIILTILWLLAAKHNGCNQADCHLVRLSPHHYSTKDGRCHHPPTCLTYSSHLPKWARLFLYWYLHNHLYFYLFLYLYLYLPYLFF